MTAKRKWSGIVLALMLAVVLCGCGVPEKTEAEIKEDLSADLSVLGIRTDVILQNVEITKRQTDQEGKTDTVYVDFSLRTEDGAAEGSGSCVMNYNLYNDGWMLENVEIEHIEYVPLKGMELSEEEVRNSVLAQYGANAISTEFELIGHSTQWELGTDWYTVSMKNEYKYMTEHLVVSLDFVFDTASGFWYQNHMGINSSKEEWNIEGLYEYGGINVVLKDKLVQGDVEGSYGYYKADKRREKETAGAGLLWFEKHLCKLSKYSNQEFWGSVVPSIDYYAKNRTLNYVVEDRFRVNFDYNRYDFCLLLRRSSNTPVMVFIGKNDIVYAKNFETDQYKRIVAVETVPLLRIEQ